MASKKLQRLRKIAEEHRATHPENKGGVVTIFKNQAFGWMCELHDPFKVVPGAFAVDENGNCFEAVGGNDYDGAEEWVPCESAEVSHG